MLEINRIYIIDASLYSTHQIQATNLNIGQPTIYAPMVSSNPGAGAMRPPVPSSFYSPGPQPSMEYDFKQQISGTHIYNYVPLVQPNPSNFIHQQQQAAPQQPTQGQNQNPGLHHQSLGTVTSSNPNPVSSQHGAGISLPILVHQQPIGQIQYLFPAQALQQQVSQQAQQHAPTGGSPYPITPDGQYVQVII